MHHTFTNDFTARVFHTLERRPDLLERAYVSVRKSPAASVEEIKEFVSDLVRIESNLVQDLARDLMITGLRNVRWSEIRAAIQEELAA